MEEVHLLGRRGPVQAAFTPKELRELLGLPGVQVCRRCSPTAAPSAGRPQAVQPACGLGAGRGPSSVPRALLRCAAALTRVPAHLLCRPSGRRCACARRTSS